MVKSFRPREGPKWPLALELARGGHPIGCALISGCAERYSVCVIDADGEIFCLREGLDVHNAVHWALLRSLYVCHSLGELSGALRAGRCAGWVHGRIDHVAVPFRHVSVRGFLMSRSVVRLLWQGDSRLWIEFDFSPDLPEDACAFFARAVEESVPVWALESAERVSVLICSGGSPERTPRTTASSGP